MRLIPDDCCHYRYPTHLQRYCSATRATSHGSSRVFCWAAVTALIKGRSSGIGSPQPALSYLY